MLNLQNEPGTHPTARSLQIELIVTNSLGESATDCVHLRLLRIPAGHPRIYLTPAKLAALQAHAMPSNPRWVQLLGEADAGDGEMHAKAPVSQITGQTAYCDQAIADALALTADPADWSTKAGDHFSYHQYYDQNSFTLFKGGDLLVQRRLQW